MDQPHRRTPSFGGFGITLSPRPPTPGGPPALPVGAAALEPLDLVREFFQGAAPPTPPQPLRAEDVSQDVNGLRRLAQLGTWREVVRLCERCVGYLALQPHERMQWRFAQAFAFAKMHLLTEAGETLEHHILQVPTESTLYETFPSVYGDRKGTMVPFAARLLYARLPLMKQDLQLAQTRLYALLPMCDPRPPDGEGGEAVSTLDEIFPSDNDTAAQWRTRRRLVRLELVNAHTQLHQHTCAITLLMELLGEYTPDMRRSTPNAQLEYAELLQRLGRVHLDMGQVGPAEDAFSRVEAIDSSSLSPAEQRQLSIALALNRGALSVAQQLYSRGFEEFAVVLKEDPRHLEAAINQALCALYSCRLTEAIAILEALIRTGPHQALTEPLVFNLCSMYDLESDSGPQKKRVLQAVVQRYKGEFFPAKALRLD